ncbi:MAG: methyltransferase dimerization domain-containing protein [Bacteroidota bacterium]
MTGKKISSPVELMEIVNGFRSSKIILTAYELGLFSILSNGKKTSSEIASVLNLNQRASDRLMNALTALGLLEKKREKFRNTSFSLKFLVKTSPAYMGGIAHIVNLWDTWDKMTDSVRAGTAILNEDKLMTGAMTGLKHLFQQCIQGRHITQELLHHYLILKM